MHTETKRPSFWASACQNIAHSVRQTIAKGYKLGDLRADFLAGLVVGIIALPLSMALGIASGVAPEHGLYTAIVAGVVTALLGGAPKQVTGPTAAFVVLLVPVIAKFGLGGLAIASLMAGVWLTLMGFFRLGTLVRFVPMPVTLGFTGGIAVVIATLQLKDFLGLSIAKMPETYFGKVQAIAEAMPTLRPADAMMGFATLAVLLLWPRLTRKVPAPLVALTLASIAGFVLADKLPGFEVQTIQSRFTYLQDGVRHAGIPRTPPWPTLHWLTQGPDNTTLTIDWSLIKTLLPASFAIAMLAAIESLLAAVVADRMGGTRHNSDAELLGAGIGNMVSPFFGGFAATGAIARTAANIRSGARSPLAALIHAAFVLATMMLMAPLLGYMPMASLAALLLTVAYNMGEPKHLIASYRQASTADKMVLAVCLTLTVVFDMVVSIGCGVVLAVMLFCRAASAQAATQISTRHDPQTKMALPDDVWICDVQGPLFFGTVESCLGSLQELTREPAHTGGAVIVDLRAVPVLDGTGVFGLKQMIEGLNARGMLVVLVSPQPTPAVEAYTRAPWRQDVARSCTTVHRQEAIVLATRHVAR